jgi:multidrug resistance efflux pump
MRTLLIVAVLAATAIGALLVSQRRGEPYSVSGFLEADDVRLGSRVGGRVLRVQVAEGQAVETGQTLVELEPYDLQERLAEARATRAARDARLRELRAGFRVEEIAEARSRRERFQATLEKLERGPRPLDIQILKDKLEQADAELKWAEAEHTRVTSLFESGAGAREERDTAVRRLEVARAAQSAAANELALAQEGTRAEDVAAGRAQLAEAQAQLDLLEAGTRKEQVEQAEAATQSAQATVTALEKQLSECVIQSPCDGVVEAVDLQPGDLVPPNAPALTVLDRSKLWIRAYVPADRLDLETGRRVRFRVDALPARDFHGVVVFVAREAEFTPSNAQTPEERVKQVFRVKVEIEPPHEPLRPGMFADVFLEPAP